jgi:hypothetical protein
MRAWPMLLGFSSVRLYKLLSSYRRTHLRTDLGFDTSPYLRCLHSLLHPERRREPANGRAGLRNHSPLRSYTEEGKLGFWEALCATTRVLHHGSSSIQVGKCCLPPSSSPSASTGLLQHCHQQRYRCNFICKRTVRASCYCLHVYLVL